MDSETLQTLINIRNYNVTIKTPHGLIMTKIQDINNISDLLEKYPDYISLNVDNIGGCNEQKNR